MQPTVKPVEDATTEELRDFAKINLGLEIEGNENRNIVLAKMKRAGMEPETIAIIPRAAPVTAKSAGATKEENGKIYHKIIIPAAEGVGGDTSVYTRVNGEPFVIARGVESWVPEQYVESLRNATGTAYEMSEAGIDNPRDVLAYPFSHVA